MRDVAAAENRRSVVNVVASVDPMSTSAQKPAVTDRCDPTVAARVEQLYEEHATLVGTVCRSLLRDRVEAEDAVQQTFLSAQRALLNGSSPRDEAAWLATIARHESLARVRARMREPLPVESGDRESGTDAHVAVVRSHEARELRDALAGLPAQQRDAILLREVRGLSYQELADALAVTTSSVESLLFRARRSLRARLREALAALSPAELVQPLRELAARAAGGGLVAPAAAKVAALGVGTAVVTGGALAGPQVLGLGHAPTRPAKTAGASTHRAFAAGAPSEPGATPWAGPAPRPARAAAVLHLRAVAAVSHESGSSREVSDGPGAGDNHEREHSDGSGGTAPEDASSGTGSGSKDTDGSRTHEAESDSTGDRSRDRSRPSGDSSSDATDSGSDDDAAESSPGSTTDSSSGAATTTESTPGKTTTDSAAPSD